jgi:hypothetical protein
MAKIYVGPPAGGSGGGGSVNPTTGILPVNQFGTFQDSNIISDVPSLTTSFIDVNDATSRISITSQAARVDLDGTTTSINITGVDIELNGDVNINNHLGLALLKFVGGTAAFPALKRNGANLEVRTANDANFTNITANDVTAAQDIISTKSFITVAKSIIESITNGNFTLYNNGKTAFSLLQFGGVSNTFPALKRAATELQVRLADDSGAANIRAGVFIVDAATGGVQFTTTMNLYVGTSSSNSVLFGNLAGVAIGKGAALPVASAQLEVVSTSRGVLFPRMTAAQRTAIATPAVGLMVYQTDGGAAEGIWINKSTGWVQGV